MAGRESTYPMMERTLAGKILCAVLITSRSPGCHGWWAGTSVDAQRTWISTHDDRLGNDGRGRLGSVAHDSILVRTRRGRGRQQSLLTLDGVVRLVLGLESLGGSDSLLLSELEEET